VADPVVGDGLSDPTSWPFKTSQYCGSLGPGASCLGARCN
jgi:hypothetical protein